MTRQLHTIALAGLLAACASTPRGSDTAASVLPNPVVEYRCESGEQITVRLDGPSAAIRYNGVNYVLPQLNTEAGVTQYSDGRHLLMIRQGRTFFGLGRAEPRLCTAR